MSHYRGYYDHDEAVKREGSQWVERHNLEELLNSIAETNFEYQKARSDALAEVASLPKTSHIYGHELRFPGAGEQWICVGDGQWPKLFSDLDSSLTYKTPDITGTDKNLETSTNNTMERRKNHQKDDDNEFQGLSERGKLEKAKLVFVNTVANMRYQAMNTALWQVKFERKFNLRWHQEEEHEHVEHEHEEEP